MIITSSLMMNSCKGRRGRSSRGKPSRENLSRGRNQPNRKNRTSKRIRIKK